MQAQAAIRVVCENCDGTDWTAITIGLIGVLVGALALVYSARASKIAKDTLDVTREEHELAQAQHDLDRQQFEQEQVEQAARADFKLTIGFVDADAESDGGIITTSGSTIWVRLQIGIENVGTRAAGPTKVNVLVPARYGNGTALRWCNADGTEGLDLPAAAITAELVGEGDAASPATYLSRRLQSVSRRGADVMFIRMAVSPPTDGHIELPVRAKAQADELPDDIDEVILDRVLRVRQRGHRSAT